MSSQAFLPSAPLPSDILTYTELVLDDQGQLVHMNRLPGGNEASSSSPLPFPPLCPWVTTYLPWKMSLSSHTVRLTSLVDFFYVRTRNGPNQGIIVNFLGMIMALWFYFLKKSTIFCWTSIVMYLQMKGPQCRLCFRIEKQKVELQVEQDWWVYNWSKVVDSWQLIYFSIFA